MPELMRNLKFALRLLRKSPGFALVAVLIMALGIGANTAIFSVVHAVLLEPLPFHDADRLVQIWHVPPQKSFPGMTRFAVSAANFIDWQKENHVFEHMALYSFTRYDITGAGKPVTRAAYFQPLADELRRLGPLSGRVEVPELTGHWDAAYLARSVPMARGWLRQTDTNATPEPTRRPNDHCP